MVPRLSVTTMFNAELVKAAIKKIKPDKSDVSGLFTSDCLKSAPDILFTQLASLFRTSLCHGYISHDLLVCALSPIVKDPNGDISASKNYRGIAISSLILNVLTTVFFSYLERFSPMMHSSLASSRVAPQFNALGQFSKQFHIILEEVLMSTAAC